MGLFSPRSAIAAATSVRLGEHGHIGASHEDPHAHDLSREIILDASALGTAEITVRGLRRSVASVDHGDYRALQFDDDGVLVTVVTRHLQWSDLPELVRIDDLEPYLRPLEHIGREAVAAYFRYRERRWKAKQRCLGYHHSHALSRSHQGH
jgi:hypothetical protein